MPNLLPKHSRVVIIGGGVMGCALAYHLAREGWGHDTVLLEKAELTSGSTWHAAGQITQSTSSYSLGRVVDYNIKLYSEILESETGSRVSWHGCGSLRLAYSEDEMDWLRQSMSVGKGLGFNIDLVDPQFIAKKHPFYNLDGVLGALFTPDDGHVDPSSVTMALASGAKQKGVKIFRRCLAKNITQNASKMWVVETEMGNIICEHVVNAGGTYARQMGEWSNLQLPMTSMTHHYFVTENVKEFENLDDELPVIRDDKFVSGYIRMEQKKGLIGIYEKENSNSVWEDHCPWEAENELFEPDYNRVMPWLENAMERMPVLSALGITREIHGAISHPPDGNPLIGPAPGVQNYWCCCGTQIGIGWGPALTRELARWIVHGASDISMRDFDPRRFGAYANKKWQMIKAHEDYKLRHEIPFPHFNRLEGRPIKKSPLYERLKSKGAVYEEVYGFERPRWFARQGIEQRDYYSFRRNQVFDMVELEVKNIRQNVALMDITAFSKIIVEGPDARDFLDPLIANHLPKKDHAIIVAHMLNKYGRIELELTILRIDFNCYYLVCAAFFEQRLIDHLNAHKKSFNVGIKSKSDHWAAIALNGPFARHVLKKCAIASLANADFPWMSAKKITITHPDTTQNAIQDIWALRMSYAGELGWELHMEFDKCLAVYDALWKAGKAYNIVDYGSFAMNVCRMEKAFPGAGELTNEVTLIEANVTRFVKFDKDFIGIEQTEKSAKSARSGTLRWICGYLEIEPDGVFDGHGGEAVLLNGQIIGAISSIIYSHTLKKILAFAYIKPFANTENQEIEILIAGQKRKGKVLKNQALYDPQNLKPREDMI
ncbi:MAG: FAD-dependent oxidoreductase [Pseudomonadota bacterium]